MSRWAARWRVALRIARRDAARHKGRTALVVAMVALPLLAGTAMISLIRSTMPTPAGEIAATLGPSAQAEIAVADCRPYLQDATGFAGGCDADDDQEVTPLDRESVEQVLGVSDVAPRWHVGADLVTGTAAIDDQWVVEVERAEVLAEIAETVDGRLPTQPGEAALVPGLARRLGATIGDTVMLQQKDESVEVEVVGLLDPRSHASAAVLSSTVPAAWRLDEPTWLVLGAEPVTWDQVVAANDQGWQVFSRAVALDPPPIDQTPYGQTFPDSSYASLQTVGLVGAVVAMGLLEIVLLIGPAFAVGAKRSARQLALTAAAGGSPADLRRIVLASGFVAGAAAAVLGIGLGAVLLVIGTTIANRTMDSGYLALVLPVGELAALALVGLLLGVGAAWLPARAAARCDVTESLAGRRGDPRPARGIGRLGAALAVLGLLVMLLGAVTHRPEALVAGVVTLEIGVVMTSGAIVVGMGRLAPRLGVAGRFAVRDAVRHRSRTAPAVAAVLAAVAAAAAGGIYLQGQITADQAAWTELSASPGLVLQWSGDDLTDSERAVTDALSQIASQIDVEDAVLIHAAWAPPEGSVDGSEADVAPTMSDVYDVMVYGTSDPELACPESNGSTDPRCSIGFGVSHPTASLSLPGTLIDDGTFMTAAGLEGWRDAAETLAHGGVVVELFATWSDGSAHLVGRAPGLSEDPEQAVVLPAYGAPWLIPTYATVLSPEAAEDIGVTPVVVGGLVTTAFELDQAEVDRLNGLVREISPYLSLTADRPRPEGVPIGLVLLAVASVVALAAVGLSVGLAGADTRPDMATLAAVGAPPSVRRRVAAAQAGVIAGAGAVLGVLTGIPIGLVLSLWGRETSGYGDLWPLTVPWPVPVMAVVIPLLAMGVSWLCTRPSLPLARRVAE